MSRANPYAFYQREMNQLTWPAIVFNIVLLGAFVLACFLFFQVKKLGWATAMETLAIAIALLFGGFLPMHHGIKALCWRNAGVHHLKFRLQADDDWFWPAEMATIRTGTITGLHVLPMCAVWLALVALYVFVPEARPIAAGVFAAYSWTAAQDIMMVNCLWRNRNRTTTLHVNATDDTWTIASV